MASRLAVLTAAILTGDVLLVSYRLAVGNSGGAMPLSGLALLFVCGSI
jgi:hypothetical protein